MGYLELVEHQSIDLPAEGLSYELGQVLWQKYGCYVNVDFPSPKTNGRWRLTPQGWVGFIPLAPDLSLHLRSKVPIRNLFAMLGYAYRLHPRILERLVNCKSMDGMYEVLAIKLAEMVIERGHRGFYRSYKARTERLPYLRGRLLQERQILRPWDVGLDCVYHEHTTDLEDNQILLWTLRRIMLSGICREDSRPLLRRAYRDLLGFASLKPFTPQSCLERRYDRLNLDYRPMHALCRFFLENTGPSLEHGDHKVLPFLVDMARLYEQFVARWLQVNLEYPFSLRAQEVVQIGPAQANTFKIDLVIYGSRENRPLMVLDTKYKSPKAPSNEDIFQVVAYAEAIGCNKAALVFPAANDASLDLDVGRISVSSMAFSLDDDLEKAGQAFLDDLLRAI
ncbi:MAG: restriction endonuclease [Methanotrichaceae archaeon]|nr:restriction endonuclease [Methanotrichaceae archaeon]